MSRHNSLPGAKRDGRAQFCAAKVPLFQSLTRKSLNRPIVSVGRAKKGGTGRVDHNNIYNLARPLKRMDFAEICCRSLFHGRNGYAHHGKLSV